MAWIQDALVWDKLVLLPTHGKHEVRVNSLLMTGYNLTTVSSCLHKNGFQPPKSCEHKQPLTPHVCMLSLFSTRLKPRITETFHKRLWIGLPINPLSEPRTALWIWKWCPTHQSLSLWFRNILKDPRLWTSSCWKSFSDHSFVQCS